MHGDSIQFDFTAAASKAYGSNVMKELESGIWGSYAGDGNADGLVTAPDFNMWSAATSIDRRGYQPADFNLDGIVTAPDFNLWSANTSAGAKSNVP